MVPGRDAECKDLSAVGSHLGPPSNLLLASFPNLLTFFSQKSLLRDFYQSKEGNFHSF